MGQIINEYLENKAKSGERSVLTLDFLLSYGKKREAAKNKQVFIQDEVIILPVTRQVGSVRCWTRARALYSNELLLTCF